MMGEQGTDGRVFILEPSAVTVTKGLDDRLTPATVTFRSYYRDGQSATRTAYSGRFIIQESDDGSTWTTKYTSSANEATVAFTPDADMKMIQCTLYAAGGTTSALDRQTVNILTDISNLTQEITFNKLTNDGALQGIYMEDGELYINFSFAKGGTLVLGGLNDINGILQVRDSNNNTVVQLNKDGMYTEESGVGTLISSGNVKFSADGAMLGRVTAGDFTLAEYTGSLSVAEKTGKGVGFVTSSEFATMGVVDEDTDAYSMKYLLNNGFNPTGTSIPAVAYNALHMFWGNVLTFGTLRVGGNFSSTGSKNREVGTEHYGQRLQSCYEMANPMFGDVGAAQTGNDGICYISIDDIFKETVSEHNSYYVFLQKEGEGDLWIKEKNNTYFVVKGTPNLSFAWELKAKQRGYEYDRLNAMVDETDKDIDYGLLGSAAAEKYYKELEMNEYGEY